MAEQASAEAVVPSDTVQQAVLNCNGVKDLARCLQKAARSPSPLTLDLDQITIDHPQHLAALCNLCSSAASHVTLSNGKIVLGGGGKPVLSISCGRLCFKNMEIVRLVTGTPPPAPGSRDGSPSTKNTGPSNSMMLVNGNLAEGAPTSTHVTLEDCTLRMEGDPRYCASSAIIAHGASLLRMDRCKLLNMHSWLLVMMLARVELHDCHVAMVYGTRLQLHAYLHGHVELHGCALVEEEGTCLPPASSLARVVQEKIPQTSMYIAFGSTLQLVNSRLRMPLGAQLGSTDYVIECSSGIITAINTSFDGSHVSLSHPEPGCAFTRCTFSGVRPAGAASAFLSCVSRRIPHAVLRSVCASGLVVEDCTFTNAPDRVAIQTLRLTEDLPPEGGPPLVHIKACTIVNCLHGIQVPIVHLDDFSSIQERLGKPKGRLTVEVDDTTIEVTPSPIAPHEPQTCLFFEGHIVCATVRRCVLKAAGKAVDVVFAKEGAHLVMTDCTVTLHGPGTAIMLGLKDSPAYAVIKRTTITADAPAQFALTDLKPIAMDGRAWSIDGVLVTVYALERALQRNLKNRVMGHKVIEHEGGLYEFVMTTTSVDGAIATLEMAREVPGFPSLILTWDGSTKLVDCKIQGSQGHCGVMVQGAGKVEVVMCEIAVEGPLLVPWAASDPGGTVILRDCTVGRCTNDADMMEGTYTVLDNTPYRWWADLLPANATPPQGCRPLMFVHVGRDEQDRIHRTHRMTYITSPQPITDGEDGNGSETEGGASSGGSSTASSSAGSGSTATRRKGRAGLARGPLLAVGDTERPDFCWGCRVPQAEWAAAQGDPSRVMPWCRGCTCVRYCSRECQVRSWSEHKPMCRYISQHYSQATGGSKASKGNQ